jgi:hypothetical protein
MGLGPSKPNNSSVPSTNSLSANVSKNVSANAPKNAPKNASNVPITVGGRRKTRKNNKNSKKTRKN